MKAYTGQYFDGKSSRPITVEVKISGRGISMSYSANNEGYENIHTIEYSHDEIKKYAKQHKKLTLYFGENAPYQSLSVEDVSLLSQLEKEAPYAKCLKTPYRFFEKIGVLGYIGAVLFIIGFVLFGNFVVLPFMAKQVANNFPKEYEKSLGEQSFNNFMAFYTVDSAKTELIKEYASHIDFDTDYELDIYVVDNKMVNAFALPGGKVVVFRGILDKMDGHEELAALLGHEVGHVAHRHSLKMLINQYASSFILDIFTGNSGAISKKLGGVAINLTGFSHSRDAERQADDYGLKVLRANKIDNYGAVHLFEKLETQHTEEETSTLEIFEVMSTHPNTKDRIKDMKADIKSLGNNGEIRPELKEIWKKIK